MAGDLERDPWGELRIRMDWWDQHNAQEALWDPKGYPLKWAKKPLGIQEVEYGKA